MNKPDPDQTSFTKNRYNTTSSIYDIMEWPVEQLWYKKWRRKLWQEIHGPIVLEIGVGTGKNIPHYPRDIELTGIDLSPGMLKYARQLLSEKQHGHIDLREMDAQNMSFPDNHFDETVATFAFCSIPDPVLGLKEALRVTKPGGKLHLLEHTSAESSLLAKLMKKLDVVTYYLIGVHIARKTAQNVENAGWEIDNVRELSAQGIFKRIEATKPR